MQFHRLLLRCCCALALCLWVESPCHGQASAPQVLAYFEQDDRASSAALRQRYGSFTQLAADTYTVSALGVIKGATPVDDLQFARSQGLGTFAVVSNFAGTDFRPSLAQAIVRSPRATGTFIATLLQVLRRGGYQGANIDFEGVPASDRAFYTAFIKKLAARLHAAHYQVIVSVPAKLTEDRRDSWTGAFDFAKLGRFADVVQLMTYDEHGSWSEPGPSASLPWVRASVEYALTVIPANKLSFGLPAYGYDWDLADAEQNTQIPWNALPALLSATGATEQWDITAASPFLTYMRDGHEHLVWYENAASLQAKLEIAREQNLGGVSVYALGMEDAQFWQAIAGGRKQ